MKKTRTEQLHKLLLENLPDYVLLVDRDGAIHFLNKASQGPTKKEVLGANVYDYIDADVRPGYKKTLAEVVLTGQTRNLETPTRSGTDDVRSWYNVRFVPVKDGTEVISVMLIGTDITLQKKVENEQLVLIAELREALAKIKALKKLIPICSVCQKIRDDDGYWHQVDVYLRDHSGAEVSHGYCPECKNKLISKLYGEHDTKDPITQPEDSSDSE